MVGNTSSTLENRVGDYMTGGNHGAHAAHDDHEEPDNPFADKLKKMAPYEVLTFIKGHHTKGHERHIADLDERAKVLHQVYEAFEDEEVKGALTKELMKPFKNIKLKHEKYQGLYKKLKEAYEENDKDPLHLHQSEEHIKDLVDEIFADLGYGLSGNRDQNYTTFRAYLSQMKDGDKNFAQVVEHISKGKGRQATKGIVDLLKGHRQAAYEGEIQSAVVTEDIPDFHDAYAGVIEEKVKAEYPEGEVLRGLISKNIKEYAKKAVDGEWEAIYEAAKHRIKKDQRGAAHGTHAAHH